MGTVRARLPCTLLATGCACSPTRDCLCLLEYGLAQSPLAALSVVVLHKRTARLVPHRLHPQNLSAYAVIVQPWCFKSISQAIMRSSALQVLYSRCTVCRNI